MSNWPATGIYTMNWCRICPHAKSKYNKGGMYDLNDPKVQKYLDGHQEDQINLFVDETSAVLYWTMKRDWESWRSERTPGESAPAPVGPSGLEDVDEFEDRDDIDYVLEMQDKLEGITPIKVGLDQMQGLVNIVGISTDIADLSKCLYPDDDDFEGDEDPNDPEGFDEDDPEPGFDEDDPEPKLEFSIANVAKLIDEDNGPYQIKIICGWCKKPLGFKPTTNPKQHGEISHGMCRPCEVEQYRQLGMAPPDVVKESLDDVDTFEVPKFFCDKCEMPVGEGELIPLSEYEPRLSPKVCQSCYDIAQQGPQDDRWLGESVLDDQDTFADNSRCERCNSRDTITNQVEPVHFNNTMEYLCRWCSKELFMNLDFVENIVKEDLEDADEFGHIEVTASYEETGPDYVKIIDDFEDGARVYWYSSSYKDYDGRSAWMNSTCIRTVTGQLRKFSYDPEVLVPGWAAPYIDAMDVFSGDEVVKKPFTQEMLKEFDAAIDSKESDISESLDDKDEFTPHTIHPTKVYGSAYTDPNGENVSLTYEYEDGAKVYMAGGKIDDHVIDRFVLREPDGTVRKVPKFRSNVDSPEWFTRYYLGMFLANVHEKNGVAMCAQGPLPPFTAEQRREWTQTIGMAPVTESLDDTDEFGDIAATDVYEETGPGKQQILFNFEDGAKVYYHYGLASGADVPNTITILKLPGGETYVTHNEAPDAPPSEHLAPYYEALCDGHRVLNPMPFTPEALKEFNDAMAAANAPIKEDLDDTDEFQDPTSPQLIAWVKWPEGKFESPEAAVAAAFFMMEQQDYNLVLDDTYTFKPTDKNNPNRWKYEKIRLIAFVPNTLVQALREDGDLTFGSTHREPWVIFDIDVQDNEWVHPPRRDDDEGRGRRSGYRVPGYSWDESETPEDIARVIGEDSPPTIGAEQLAKILNSNKIKPDPLYIHPPGLELAPKDDTPTQLLPSTGSDLDDVDEFEEYDCDPCAEDMPHGGWHVELVDASGKDITQELKSKYQIELFIAEHPEGFDTGGCVIWMEIQDDWDGQRPFPNIYYWRGLWRAEDYRINQDAADGPIIHGPAPVAESLDDNDEFGNPPFIHIAVTDPQLSPKDAIARTIDALKNPRGSHMNGWDVTGIEVTSYMVRDKFDRADNLNTPSYEELENIPGALTSIEGFLQHNEPRLNHPDLAFTDNLEVPGMVVQTYVGY